MKIVKEVNPHPRIVPCVNMRSGFLFFLSNVGACVRHIALEGLVEWTTLA